MTNRARAIEIELLKIVGNVTQAEREAIATAAGKLFDLTEELDKQAKFMESLAERAASNILDAFADFLFDPFDEGVKGMLSWV